MLTYISFQPAPMRHRFMTQQRKFPLLQPVLQTPWRCSAPGRSCEPKIRGEGGGRRRERRWRKEEEVKYPKCSHTDAKCACMVNHPLYFISWCGFLFFYFLLLHFIIVLRYLVLQACFSLVLMSLIDFIRPSEIVLHPVVKIMLLTP